ncbi:GntR family transcriptional regulator [Roseibium sp. RKSG952]|uniref:GntR family transcriptional regulator n=1 Tax=Roseibium sp. RKSG952 TaxID=2529384 RepID=UPI0012BB4FC2|nr:GntR family transcriptional regulator [Roseibium sp. RKSG952]MTH94657.1 GntR family transcriptional regulator [Roseibium sp. RKSG952]
MTVQATKKSDQIAENLTSEIVKGAYAPGEKLRQDQIAQDYGASHVPVREALLKLVAQGLAVSIPRRGVCVAPLDRQAARELKVMRQALEPVALLHSVPNMTPAQILKAEDAQARCDNADTAIAREDGNRAFHMAIVAACGMPRLVEEIHNLQLLYARHFLAGLSTPWQKRTDKDHMAIMSAIRARDAQSACSVLQRHLAKLR